MEPTEAQISLFWAMLADRKWDDMSELIYGRHPSPDYILNIQACYYGAKAKERTVTCEQLDQALEDLKCFNGWMTETRIRKAQMVSKY